MLTVIQRWWKKDEHSAAPHAHLWDVLEIKHKVPSQNLVLKGSILFKMYFIIVF